MYCLQESVTKFYGRLRLFVADNRVFLFYTRAKDGGSKSLVIGTDVYL